MDFFLTQACKAGLLQKGAAEALNGLMDQCRDNQELDISVHGIEVHNLLNQTVEATGLHSVDFSMLVNTQQKQTKTLTNDYMHTRWLGTEINNQFKADKIWLEYDETIWNQTEHNKEVEVQAPLFYMPIQQHQSVKNITREYLENFAKIGKEFYSRNAGKDCRTPTSQEMFDWIETLPLNWQVQQIGFSFRKAKMELRVLLFPRDIEETKRFAELLEDPYLRDSSYIFGQILVAAVFPNALSDLCGVEILNDSVRIDKLENLRTPPRIKGSRLARFLRSLKLKNTGIREDLIQQINQLEARQSKNRGEILEINMQGLSHIKIIYLQKQPVAVKAYIGNVCNKFRRNNLNL